VTKSTYFKFVSQADDHYQCELINNLRHSIYQKTYLLMTA